MALDDLKRLLYEKRPAEWEMFPDIELYMDQVLSYMFRQQIEPEPETHLTSSMINNYTKAGLLPRAKGKRYSKEHLAYLTAICMLKQVLSVRDLGILFDKCIENNDIKEFYVKYNSYLDTALCDTAGRLDSEDISELILKLAISSFTEKLACEQLIKMLSEDENVEKLKSSKET